MGHGSGLVCTSPQWGGLSCYVLHNLLDTPGRTHGPRGLMVLCAQTYPELSYITILKKFPKPSSAQAQPSMGIIGR